MDKNNFSKTQRAYTLRLRGVEEGNERLWKTHEIVNRGAKAFGDWLLTLRGGLSHELADDARRKSRILLARSWLSEEPREGAPKEYIVKEDENGRQDTMGALKAILQTRGVGDEGVRSWLKDCETSSLFAGIRDDEVWVNRSMAFDGALRKIGELPNNEEEWEVLGVSFKEKQGHFKPVEIPKDGGKAENVKKYVIAKGNWLSKDFGRDRGCDYKKFTEACSKMAGWAADAREGEQVTVANLAAALGISNSASQNIEGILTFLKVPNLKSKAQTNLEQCLRKIAEESKEGTISEDRLNDLRIEAKGFRDWLLTMRGGLSHELADMGNEERRDRRILLALSWLSVESQEGAPKEYIVKEDENGGQDTKGALITILRSRKKVKDREIESWVEDCEPSLSAGIRDDAVWVNRSMAFDEKVGKINESLSREGEPLSREEVWDVLGRFFKSKETYRKAVRHHLKLDDVLGRFFKSKETYFKPADISKDGSKKEDAKNLVIAAGKWLSNRFGGDEGADFKKLTEVYSEIAKWADMRIKDDEPRTIAKLAAFLGISDPEHRNVKGILKLVSGSGHKSAARTYLSENSEELEEGTISKDSLDILKEKADKSADVSRGGIGRKRIKEWADKILESIEESLDCGFTYHREGGAARHRQFAVMLDHAARNISVNHSGIKRAEAKRRKFEEDAKKTVPKDAERWLDNYREERSESSGAIEGYRIRQSAVTGWEKVVKAWENSKTEEKRVEAARAQQDNPEIDKFGDIQLFEALSAEGAECVWKVDGKTNADILKNYVAASEAEFNRRRFKVPAYCHPHPLLHPVFCDYGKSRWNIEFGVHTAHKKSKNADDFHGLKMELWNGREIEKVPLRWQSKLLERDFDIKQKNSGEEAPAVSRASRLGRAAAGAKWEGPVSIISVFDEKTWNGRLQASRGDLNRIARRLEKNKWEWDGKAISMRRALKWFVTFSPRLSPQGPWPLYVEESEDKTPFSIRKDDRGKYEIGLHLSNNENRKGNACLVLSRLPGLRILALDLGHRHAAACAVWETMSSKQVADACAEAGCEKPSSGAMYHHIKTDRKVIYRRIGPDKLPDGSPHPAPWARLERQFLIKLQGEEGEARMVTPDEIWKVHKFERTLGIGTPLIDRLARGGGYEGLFRECKKLGWEPVETQCDLQEGAFIRRETLLVDGLMSLTVRTFRDALRRHGNRARIAYFLVTKKMIKPGGRVVELDGEGRRDAIVDALALWRELAKGRKWEDSHASKLWKEYIEPELTTEKLPDITESGISSREKKSRKKKLKERLGLAVEGLAGLCGKLSAEWYARWKEDDEKLQKQLRCLRNWILPRGKKAKEKFIRNVGGLSLGRLATVQGLYRAHKAYFTRIKPDGPKMRDGKPITADENFGRRILDDLEKMRDQRVKQLSSRIVEAALGMGRIGMPRRGGAPKRPLERVDAPCHVVVIENLTNYKPEETRARRENRQLMSWSAGKVKKYLLESCNLHGLLLREISPRYTSRQDSRTGAPGLRCEDVPVKKFLESPYWRKRVEGCSKNKTKAVNKYLLELSDNLSERLLEDGEKETTLLRIPNRGGDIFVSANDNFPASKGLQADLNAAANIGLRALADPDWPGSWWYVPCDSRNFEPLEEKVEGSGAFEGITSLRIDSGDTENSNTAEKKSNKKEVINLWRDPSCESLEAGWKIYAEYWDDVEARVINVMKRLKRQVVW